MAETFSLKTILTLSASACPQRNIRVVITSDHSRRREDEVEEAADEPANDQDTGLLAAFFAGDQDFGRGRGFGEGKFPVHVLDKVLPEGDQKQDAEEAAEREARNTW